MNAAGYSGTPLEKKLGIKEGAVIRLINQPAYYKDLFSSLPEALTITDDRTIKKDIIHYFIKDKEKFIIDIYDLKKELKENGMLWISWLKKSSKIPHNINENDIRTIGIQSGFVDIKVCAIDEDWSALKFVIPLKNRKSSK
ncbi:MAG TPA: hypothetical protein VFQ58_03155 [Flavisolibacter sp.]|nr:hypothetical protein [Flavisolibacter sp.]